MGGVTTWFAFLENLDLFSVFLPLSGDCWQFGGLGGGKETEKTVQYLCDQTISKGYGKQDFRIFAGTGYEDIAYPNLTPQMEGLKQRTDLFEFSENLKEGNLHYTLICPFCGMIRMPFSGCGSQPVNAMKFRGMYEKGRLQVRRPSPFRKFIHFSQGISRACPFRRTGMTLSEKRPDARIRPAESRSFVCPIHPAGDQRICVVRPWTSP